MTPNAIKKVKELRSEEKGKEDWPLRIGIQTGGCAGFSYDMDFDKKKDGDEIFEFDGLEIVIDKETYPKLKGSSIDYVETLAQSGFKIDNPNATKNCKCGDSFS
ncbi:iron-sulfur cluster assembly accessory protein [Candidatus Woesearchaeota archaeon]|nr:iron-sulfur cluster assembly accessory protein [Candidatus Woesearchaeota archaeon]